MIDNDINIEILDIPKKDGQFQFFHGKNLSYFITR